MSKKKMRAATSVIRENILLTGSEAAAQAAIDAGTDVVPAYPITPQTGIIEYIAKMKAKLGLGVRFISVESEHSVMALANAASQMGARVFTATSSQGLLLMHEATQWTSGARLPVVMTNVNRAIGPPWNILADQTDSLSQRDIGWIHLYAENNQEVYDLTLMAFRIAERLCLPVMPNLEGFLLSHTTEPVQLYDRVLVDRFLPKIMPPHALDINNPFTVGSSGPPDYYYGNKECLARDQRRAERVIPAVMRLFRMTFGKEYGMLESYRLSDAEIAVVAMGSITTTMRKAVDMLREEGVKAGILKIRVFRPFPEEDFRILLGHTKKIIVLDVNIREILYRETKSALYGMNIPIWGKTVGVGGVNVSAQFLADLVLEVRAESAPKTAWSEWRRESLPIPAPIPTAEAGKTIGSSEVLNPGHRGCAGCTIPLVTRHVLDILGKDTIISLPASCMSIISGPGPGYSPVRVPLQHVPFETAAVSADGIKQGAEALGIQLYSVAQAGDGGTLDIGLQALSAAAERGAKIIYVLTDNEAYMNTGGQRSSSTPFGAITETTPWPNVKERKKKNIMKIMAAHDIAYAATASLHLLDDFRMKVEKAKKYVEKGLCFIHVLTPCNTGWKIAPDAAIDLSRLAVETNVFPLFEYENKKWKITYRPDETLPAEAFLKPQGRFRKVTPEIVAQIQKDVNEWWHELHLLEEMTERLEKETKA